MNNKTDMTPQGLKTPRVAAIAGIVFSLLVITSFVLIRISIPATPTGLAADFITHLKELSFALNLLPFAGIAFLWFIAVLRDRLGELEDRFFATVFLGSGLLYIATIFALATVAGGVLRSCVVHRKTCHKVVPMPLDARKFMKPCTPLRRRWPGLS